MIDHRARPRANVPADTAPGLARILRRETHTRSSNTSRLAPNGLVSFTSSLQIAKA